MANTDFDTLITGVAPVNRDGLIQALEKRALYVVIDGEDPQDLTPGYVTHIAFGGLVFWYDSTDATTPHDGLTCLVSADGKRFKADALAGAQRRHWLVQDKDLTTPPGSPTTGHCYIVAAGAGGAWAGEDKHIAVATARGWRFIVPASFDIATALDETLIYHYSAGGAWTAGIGALTIGSDTVYPSAIRYARWGLSVVNQSTNAPPGSPADGDAYIIGGSPTGAWSGKARQIAIYEVSAWVYYPPVEGDHAYDRALNAEYVYSGSAWASQVSGYSNIKISGRLDAGGNISGTYSYSTTAPTTSNMTQQVSFDYTPLKAGATVEVDVYVADVPFTGGTWSAQRQGAAADVILGLFIDGDASATDWGHGGTIAVTSGSSSSGSTTASGAARANLIWTAPDTSSHTLKIYASFNGNNISLVRFDDVRIVVRELSA